MSLDTSYYTSLDMSSYTVLYVMCTCNFICHYIRNVDISLNTSLNMSLDTSLDISLLQIYYIYISYNLNLYVMITKNINIIKYNLFRTFDVVSTVIIFFYYIKM